MLRLRPKHYVIPKLPKLNDMYAYMYRPLKDVRVAHVYMVNTMFLEHSYILVVYATLSLRNTGQKSHLLQPQQFTPVKHPLPNLSSPRPKNLIYFRKKYPRRSGGTFLM